MEIRRLFYPLPSNRRLTGISPQIHFLQYPKIVHRTCYRLQARRVGSWLSTGVSFIPLNTVPVPTHYVRVPNHLPYRHIDYMYLTNQLSREFSEISGLTLNFTIAFRSGKTWYVLCSYPLRSLHACLANRPPLKILRTSASSQIWVIRFRSISKSGILHVLSTTSET